MKAIKANVDYKLIGQRIKKARIVKNWSQEKLAESMDVAVAFISKIERGGSSINLKRLAQISVALNVPIEEFITGVVKEKENYLMKEFSDILKQCSKDKQKLIYNIAKIVADVKFIP